MNSLSFFRGVLILSVVFSFASGQQDTSVSGHHHGQSLSNVLAEEPPEIVAAKNPEAFVRNNPLTTHFMSKGKDPLKTGGPYPIRLEAYDRGYKVKNDPALMSYWLVTGDKFNISDEGEDAILVLTPELQGCSIYIRRYKENKNITLFHHRRSTSDTPGNKEMKCDSKGCTVRVGKEDEWYDDALYYEYYTDTSFLDPSPKLCKDNSKSAGVNTILHRLPITGVWVFEVQKVCFKFGKLGEPEDMTIEGTKHKLVEWKSHGK